MAIVIKEFEVTGETETRPAPTTGTDAATPGEAASREMFERYIQQRLALRLRRWAN